ncbi:MAG: hypothetical protein E5Y88_22370 [Mesorhizobium sp.]|uniref:hypothetical protein n=1 Tax=Mesorhizobium sp. TaxID=1871066 RepID=UPI001202DACF|nr:hypothetical protein [Mesorhizobium sp.]TIL23673.1 MAG: hypothetical protein E5Y88_22370 [Mesorhizobium sp.]
MKVALQLASLADSTLLPINPKDVPIADRRHWLGNLKTGKGYNRSDPHPYRRSPALAVSRFATIAWPERKAAPIAANDNAPALSGRRPTPREWKSAGEGFPLDREFVEKRIAGYLWPVVADVACVYEAANAPEVAAMFYGEDGTPAKGMLRRVTAVQVCQTLRYRTGHLWRPLIEAAVFGKTMSEIGREYGGNKEDAAKIGRQKVIDGLQFAHGVFWDLRTFDGEDSANLTKPTIPTRYAYALGRRATDVPVGINAAGNRNMRFIRSVA